jgi:hypothetical protein
MKKIYLLAMFAFLATSSFAQSINSITPSSAYKGQNNFIIRITGSTTDYSISAPNIQAKLINGTTQDTIIGTFSSLIDPNNVEFTFNIQCSRPAATYQIITIDTYHGTLTLPSAFTILNTPTPSSTSNSPICEMLNLNFSTDPIPGAIFSWTGPNGFTSTDQSPSISSVETFNSGIYNVTATLYGCVSTPFSQNVDILSVPVINMSSNNISCFGFNDGSANPIVFGGTPPYNFAWSSGPTTQQITNLTPGVYTLAVTDLNGCMVTNVATISEPSLISTSGNFTNVSCPGGSDANITVSVSGGTPGYTYLWSPEPPSNQGSPFLLNIGNGEWEIEVTDLNGCTKLDSFSVSEPPALLVNLVSLSNVTCYGGNDGSITMDVVGGTPPYTYLWNDPANTTSLTLSNINAFQGLYTLTTTDNNGCTASNNVIISQPSAFVNSQTIVNGVICAGQSNGGISTIFTGGVLPYSCIWEFSTDGNAWNATGIGNNFNPTGLITGYYRITAADSNGCSLQQNILVAEPAPITADLVIQNPICAHVPGGMAFVQNVTGGSTIYSYTWFPNNNNNDTIMGLTVGSNFISITDQNGCSFDSTFNVNYANTLTIDQVGLSVQNNLCFQQNGHITNLSASTAQGPVSFEINGGSVTPNGLFNLTSGLFSITAIDALGCLDTVVVEIQDVGTPITVGQGSTFQPICPGVCNGTAQVDVAGGNLPYSYQWSNGLTVANGMGLCPGNYSVLVSDADGCSATASIIINEPVPIIVGTNVSGASCGLDDGSVVANVTSGGSAPFAFTWSNGDTGNTADSLAAGNYAVNVVDANQCNLYRIVAVNSSSGPTVVENLSTISCNGFSDGAIDLTITGGTAPIEVQWSNGFTTEDITGLSAGVYDVTISDASGCVILKTYQLNEPDAINLNITTTPASCGVADGEIQLVAAGGTSPYTYQWDANAGNSTATTVNSLAAGLYEVQITDNNNCATTFTAALSNDNGPSINVDQVIQPNCQTGGGNVYVTIGGGTSPYNYLWSNGAISADLQNVAEGNYSLTVTDAGNCVSTAAFQLNGINIFPQPVCMITVDTLTNNNMIIWEKTPGIGIESFRIYRETSFPGIYFRIATQPYDSLSLFIDTVASSDIHAWKYKLATVDSCGNESNFIAAHKSIHMISEVKANWDVYLQWDDYIGFPYIEFYINRYQISTGWEVIDTVSKFVHSYTDVNAPNGNVGYSITVPSPSDCEPTRVGVNTSRSNIRNQPVAAPNSLNENENILSLNIYPNPAMNEVNISLVNFDGVEVDLKLFNTMGELIFVQKVNSSNFKIDTKDLASGVYTVSVASNGKNLFKKLMIVK